MTKPKKDRELCDLRSEFTKRKKNLEGQIKSLKEKYKKDKREAKNKKKRIKREKKEVKQMKEQLVDALPERRKEEFRIAFLNKHHPNFNNLDTNHPKHKKEEEEGDK